MRLCADTVIPLQLIMLGASVLDAPAAGATATAAASAGAVNQSETHSKLSFSEPRAIVPLDALDVYGEAASSRPPFSSDLAHEIAHSRLEMGNDGTICIRGDGRGECKPANRDKSALCHNAVPILPETALAPSTLAVAPSLTVQSAVPSSLVAPLQRLVADLSVAMRLCPWQIILASVLIRQVLLPIAGLVCVQGAIAADVIDADNRVMLLVLLLQRCVEIYTYIYMNF
jgi:hypothetical protein